MNKKSKQIVSKKVHTKNFSSINQAAKQIREDLNNSVITKTKVFSNKGLGYWDQLWACLDTIADTQMAIKSFQDLKEVDFQKAPYLISYGILQALFLEQDAINNLKEALFNIRIKWFSEYPDIYLIREIRNESIGHPTKTERNNVKKYCIIDRNSLSKKGFTYAAWSNNEFSKQNIEFEALFIKQEKALLRELNEILKKIKEVEIAYAKKFKGQSLSQLIPDGEPYSMSLLRNLSYDQLSEIVFERFYDDYKVIKSGLEARFGPFGKSLGIPGTELLINELDRIFFRIKELKKSGDYVEIDLNIFADALVDRLKELKKHLEEIDELFLKKQ